MSMTRLIIKEAVLVSLWPVIRSVINILKN